MPDVMLYAAGSLRAALTDVVGAFAQAGGAEVQGRFGASGLLKDEIAGGAKADVFASANMEHPQALHAEGLSGPVQLFTRNSLCAIVRPGITIGSDTLLDAMLSPDIKLGTSTPKADPSGDYAFAMFARADAVRPGAGAVLESKALLLTGAQDSALPPDGRNVYGWHIDEGRADIFVTYATNGIAARKHYPAQKCVILPEALAVAADYGLAVLKNAPMGAATFAQFILSPSGQSILAGHGFAPIVQQGDPA